MANLQMLLNSALILIITTVSSGQDFIPRQHIFGNIEYSTSKNVPNPRPIRYDVELKLLEIDNTANKHLIVEGTCNITIQVIKPINYFKVNLSPSIQILDTKFYKRDNDSITSSFTTRLYKNQLSLFQEWTLDRTLEKEIYVIFFKYNDTVHDYEKGFFRFGYMRYKVDDNNIQWLIATNSQPNGAHRIFPCFELPGPRAPVKISVTVSNKYKILSNVIMTQEHEHYPYGLQRVVLKDTPQIPVYQVAILIYNFNYINEVQFTLADKIYSRNSDMHVDYTKEVIAQVTFLLQREWPTVKEVWNPIVNYALIPGFRYDSADGWRLVFLKESKVVYNDKLDTYGHKMAVTRFLAHRVTYQWFGCIVSLYNWTDMWINDGVSKFYGVDAINKIYPNDQMMNLFVVQDIHDALNLDIWSTMKFSNTDLTRFDMDSSVYFFRYLKGPALIRMLYYMMGSNALHRGVREHVTSKIRYVPPTIEEFWRFLQEAENDNQQSIFKNKTIRAVMNSWTERNFPILHVRTSVDADVQDIKVIVAQENSEDYNWHKWWILVTWFTDHLIDYSDRITPSLSKWLRPNDRRTTLTTLEGMNGWIIVNTMRNGYYRVDYDEQNLRRIGWFLESGFTNIHVLNRAQLIDDAFYFVRKNKLDINVFWTVTKFLPQDTNYITWYPMFKALEYMSPIFILNDERVIKLKLHVLKNLLEPLVQQIGYESISNENNLTKCLREEAVKWTCLLGNRNCTQQAQSKLMWHMQNRNQNKIPPVWRKWVYCDGVKLADSMIWHSMLRQWGKMTKRDDTLLQYLMCMQDYYVAVDTVNKVKDVIFVTYINNRDAIVTYIFFLAKYANNTGMLDAIIDTVLPNRPKQVTEAAAISTVIDNLYYEEGFERIEDYVDISINTPFTKFAIAYKFKLRREQLLKISHTSQMYAKSSYTYRR